MGCEWLAGLVSRVCLYMDCTDGRGWVMNAVSVGGAGLCLDSCVWDEIERVQILLYTSTFFSCQIFLSVGRSHLSCNLHTKAY